MIGSFAETTHLFYLDLLTPTCFISRLTALAHRIVLGRNLGLVVCSEGLLHLPSCFVLCALINCLRLINSIRCFICSGTIRAHHINDELWKPWPMSSISFEHRTQTSPGSRTLNYCSVGINSGTARTANKKIVTTMSVLLTSEFNICSIIA